VCGGWSTPDAYSDLMLCGLFVRMFTLEDGHNNNNRHDNDVERQQPIGATSASDDNVDNVIDNS